MTRAADEQENCALPLPIDRVARHTAQKLAQQQPTSEKAEQVLLNILAVFTVNYYLDLMSIATDWQKSDSCNPVIRLCANVADLELPGIGRLECRPVLSSQDSCYIPHETWNERVGYVVVQIDEELLEAKILGFVPQVQTEQLPLSQLQPLEALIEYLDQLKQSAVLTLTNLSQWFNSIVDGSWQTVESLLSQPLLRPMYAFRGSETMSGTRRAKLIDLGIQIANQPVMLIVEINPQLNQQTNIRLQLHPVGNQIYLLPGIELKVVDELGGIFLEAQARSADNYIQLQFSGEVGERFSVKIGLDDASITEHFVI
jgi:Protein of unknown function (DUF1822)